MIVSTDKDYTIPPVTFTNLTILNNLQTDFIDDFNFTLFLSSRMLKFSEDPQYIYSSSIFENVFLNDGCYVSQINGIDINNVVTDVGAQTIQSKLVFTEPVEISGQVDIVQLNNVNLKETFDSAIFVNEDATIKGNIVSKICLYDPGRRRATRIIMQFNLDAGFDDASSRRLF